MFSPLLSRIRVTRIHVSQPIDIYTFAVILNPNEDSVVYILDSNNDITSDLSALIINQSVKQSVFHQRLNDVFRDGLI
jgi:hypothetical protein